MSDYLVKEETLSTIADGIRRVTGVNEALTPPRMAEIMNAAEPGSGSGGGNGDDELWEKILNRSFTEVSDDTVTNIGKHAFGGCTNLATVSFSAATNIGMNTFSNCFNLKSLYLTGSTLCNLANSKVFYSTPIGGYSISAGTYGSIYVPASLLTSYQTATNWVYFSSRMVGI